MPRWRGSASKGLLAGDDEELVRTPSVRADLEAGLRPEEAKRAQSQRQELRSVDAGLSELKAELARRRRWRSWTSASRFICDENTIVGGCGEEFAEEDGVLCADCKLFLCFRCFGHSLVMNECQVGGRYDALVNNEGGVMVSDPGSLPCPLFPQSCQCGHVPLSEIQGALLLPENRGTDGADEDVDSVGLSPHKVFLMARRRHAEAQLAAEEGSDMRSSMLVRTRTEMRQASGLLTKALSARRGFTVPGSSPGSRMAPVESSLLTVLADRQDELEQLQDDLRQLPPITETIPPLLLRTCCVCAEPFAVSEGTQCLKKRHEHFLCNVCFGGYLLSACAPGGSYESELRNTDGMIVSPPGKLPCPFFVGHDSPQLQVLPGASQTELPANDCQCGVITFSDIERVLLDPRNSSAAFWRERRSGSVLVSLRGLARTGSGQKLTRGMSSERSGWMQELLAHNFTPANVHETARLRVAVQGNAAATAQLAAPHPGADADVSDESLLADAHTRVIDALDRGGKVSCPVCGVQTVKDDACIHMDTCPCGSSFCFLCGKENGPAAEGKCPRGEGGCDESSCYLEQHDGWRNFALEGENAARGAQKEFLRRRQAFLVRKVKDDTQPEIWARLRQQSPGLLKDVPTDGREIDWDTLDEAELPLFGANATRTDGAQDVLEALFGDVGEMDDAVAERLEQHFEAEMGRLMQDRMREQRQRYAKMVTVALLLLLVGGLIALDRFAFSAAPNPADPNPLPILGGYVPPFQNMTGVNCTENSTWWRQHRNLTAAACAPVPPLPSETVHSWSIKEQGCESKLCKLLFWAPVSEVALGSFLLLVIVLLDIDNGRDEAWFVVAILAFGVAFCLWPLLVGPFGAEWLALGVIPMFAGGAAMMFLAVPIAVIVDEVDYDDDEIWIFVFFMTTANWIAYIIVTYMARASDDTDDTPFEPLEVTCNSPCLVFRALVAGVVGTGLLGVVAHVCEEWRQGELNCHWLWKTPLLASAVLIASGWPAVVNASWLATSGPWLYWVILPCILGTWFGGLARMADFLAQIVSVRCADMVEDFARDFNIDVFIVFCPPLACCVLLHSFRCSVAEELFVPAPLWSQILLWLGVGLVAFGSASQLVAYIVVPDPDFDEDIQKFYAKMAVFLTVVSSPSCWNLFGFIYGLIVGSLPIAGIFAILGTIAVSLTESERCACLFGGLACVGLFSFVGGMIYVYNDDDYIVLGDTADLPTGFEVSGATSESLNGLYILREDLATCDERFNQDYCDRCGDTQFYYQLVAGCQDQACVLRAKDDPKWPSFPTLFQPKDGDLWLVSSAAEALQSCGRNFKSVLHSPHVRCYQTPSGDGCTDHWSEVLVDGNGTSVWTDAAQLIVTDHAVKTSVAARACAPSLFVAVWLFTSTVV